MKYRQIIVYLLGVIAASAQAEERDWQWHGFASHAMVYADQHYMGSAQPKQWGNYLSEAGASLSWRADANWLVSAQLLARSDGVLQGTPRWDVAAVYRLLRWRCVGSIKVCQVIGLGKSMCCSQR